MIDISRLAYEHAPLKKVLMHRPEVELPMVTEATLTYFNFAAVPKIDTFLEEFDGLVAALQQMGMRSCWSTSCSKMTPRRSII